MKKLISFILITAFCTDLWAEKSYKSAKILGIIPARSGSKGIKNKNIVPVFGKPLIVWTIEAAKKSKYLTDFVVSTNGDSIAKISSDHGAEVIMRPEELSTDTAPTISTVMHVIRELKKHGRTYDYVVILQPTSPLRTEKDIDGIIKFTVDKNLNSVVSVHKIRRLPMLMRYMDDTSKLDLVVNVEENRRRQDCKQTYYVNGALFIFRSNLLNDDIVLNLGEHGFIMDPKDSIDLDTPEDLKKVEAVLKAKRKK